MTKYGEEYLESGELSNESIAYAMSGLIPFIQVIFRCTGKEFIIQPFHNTIADLLEKCMLGQERRVIINLPPRSGKTAILEGFCAYTLGLNPASNNIWCSYAQGVATESSTRIRDILNSDYYKQIFPGNEISKDTDSKARFTTVNRNGQRGDFIALGATGALTGRGAGTKGEMYGGAIIIDDPQKPEDANSDLSRGAVNNWFYQTLYSRRNSAKTPIIIIQQRLHQEDLTGFLLSKAAEEWNQITIAAIDKDGKSIWEDQYPLDEINRMKNQSPAVFETQYMQQPVPPDGVMFQKDKINYSTDIPEHYRVVISTDFAVSKDRGDYTVFSVLGMDKEDNIYLLEVYRAQQTPDVWCKELIALVNKWNPIEILVESGPIFNSAENTIKAEMTKQNAYATVKKTTRTKDKITSVQTFLGIFNEGRFFIKKGLVNGGDVESELLSFPRGKHDDIVDTFALLGLNWRRTVNSNIDPNVDLNFSLNEAYII